MTEDMSAQEQSMGGEKDQEPEKGSTRPSPQRRLSNLSLPAMGLDDRFSMRIPAIHDAQHTAEKTHGLGHWKVAVLEFIHSEPVQTALMLLLIADVFILFIELFLVGYYPPCHIIERDAISCCAADYASNVTEHAVEAEPEHGDNGHHLLRFLAGSEGGHDAHHNLCVSPSVESHEFEATCDPHKWTSIHTLEKVLFVLTVTILSIFMVELLIMVMVLGKAFFRQFFYVLDLFIVSTSLALEIVFATLHEEYLVALTGILLFGRVWRFVRIGHGLIEVASEYAAKDKKILFEYAESLEKILQENDITLPEKSKELRHVEKSLSHHSAH